jgi:hypothetical protein
MRFCENSHGWRTSGKQPAVKAHVGVGRDLVAIVGLASP